MTWKNGGNVYRSHVGIPSKWLRYQASLIDNDTDWRLLGFD